MESAKDFFCHTCKQLFKKAIASDDEDVVCPSCQEYFVEMIEDPAHLASLKGIYNQ